MLEAIKLGGNIGSRELPFYILQMHCNSNALRKVSFICKKNSGATTNDEMKLKYFRYLNKGQRLLSSIMPTQAYTETNTNKYKRLTISLENRSSIFIFCVSVYAFQTKYTHRNGCRQCGWKRRNEAEIQELSINGRWGWCNTDKSYTICNWCVCVWLWCSVYFHIDFLKRHQIVSLYSKL